MKKKIILLLISTAILISLAGCGSSAANTNANQNSSDKKVLDSSQDKSLKDSSSTASTSDPKEPTKPSSPKTPDASAKTTASNNTNSSTTKTNSSGANLTSAPTSKSEAFYGNWKIKNVIAYGPVSEYSTEDTKRIIGKVVKYSSSSAVFDTKTCNTPHYIKNTVSASDFSLQNKTSFAKLGISAASLTYVNVFTDEAHKDLWDSTGSFIYIKNANTLIIFDGGVYFEADRI